jgi:hypothetical protein
MATRYEGGQAYEVRSGFGVGFGVGLTQRQRAFVVAWANLRIELKQWPSIRQTCEVLEIRNTSVGVYLVDCLERHGILRRGARTENGAISAHTIELTRKGWIVSGVTPPEELLRPRVLKEMRCPRCKAQTFRVHTPNVCAYLTGKGRRAEPLP